MMIEAFNSKPWQSFFRSYIGIREISMQEPTEKQTHQMYKSDMISQLKAIQDFVPLEMPHAHTHLPYILFK